MTDIPAERVETLDAVQDPVELAEAIIDSNKPGEVKLLAALFLYENNNGKRDLIYRALGEIELNKESANSHGAPTLYRPGLSSNDKFDSTLDINTYNFLNAYANSKNKKEEAHANKLIEKSPFIANANRLADKFEKLTKPTTLHQVNRKKKYAQIEAESKARFFNKYGRPAADPGDINKKRAYQKIYNSVSNEDEIKIIRIEQRDVSELKEELRDSITTNITSYINSLIQLEIPFEIRFSGSNKNLDPVQQQDFDINKLEIEFEFNTQFKKRSFLDIGFKYEGKSCEFLAYSDSNIDDPIYGIPTAPINMLRDLVRNRRTQAAYKNKGEVYAETLLQLDIDIDSTTSLIHMLNYLEARDLAPESSTDISPYYRDYNRPNSYFLPDINQDYYDLHSVMPRHLLRLATQIIIDEQIDVDFDEAMQQNISKFGNFGRIRENLRLLKNTWHGEGVSRREKFSISESIYNSLGSLPTIEELREYDTDPVVQIDSANVKNHFQFLNINNLEIINQDLLQSDKIEIAEYNSTSTDGEVIARLNTLKSFPIETKEGITRLFFPRGFNISNFELTAVDKSSASFPFLEGTDYLLKKTNSGHFFIEYTSEGLSKIQSNDLESVTYKSEILADPDSRKVADLEIDLDKVPHLIYALRSDELGLNSFADEIENFVSTHNPVMLNDLLDSIFKYFKYGISGDTGIPIDTINSIEELMQYGEQQALTILSLSSSAAARTEVGEIIGICSTFAAFGEQIAKLAKDDEFKFYRSTVISGSSINLYTKAIGKSYFGAPHSDTRGFDRSGNYYYRDLTPSRSGITENPVTVFIKTFKNLTDNTSRKVQTFRVEKGSGKQPRVVDFEYFLDNISNNYDTLEYKPTENELWADIIDVIDVYLNSNPIDAELFEQGIVRNPIFSKLFISKDDPYLKKDPIVFSENKSTKSTPEINQELVDQYYQLDPEERFKPENRILAEEAAKASTRISEDLPVLYSMTPDKLFGAVLNLVRENGDINSRNNEAQRLIAKSILSYIQNDLTTYYNKTIEAIRSEPNPDLSKLEFAFGPNPTRFMVIRTLAAQLDNLLI